MAKKVGRKLLAFAGVVTVVQLLVFHHYNKLFLSVEGGTEAPKTQEIKTTVSKTVEQEMNRLKNTYPVVSFSDDDKYAAYVNSQNVLYVENLATKRDVCKPITDLYKVQYICWAGDSRLLLGEQISPGRLELNTVDVSNGSQPLPPAQLSSYLSPNAQIVKIVFNSVSNDIYILVNAGQTNSAVFYIDANRTVHDVQLGIQYIETIALGQNNNRLYFEDHVNDGYHVGYFEIEHPTVNTTNYVPHVIKTNAALIDVVDNTVYYGDLTNVNGVALVSSVFRWNPTTDQSSLVSKLDKPMKRENLNITSDGKLDII